MIITKYINGILKSKILLHVVLFLLLIRFILIPLIHHLMSSHYCEKIIKLNYLNVGVDIFSGIMAFSPMIIFNLIIFILSVIIIVIKKNNYVYIDVFVTIIAISIIPALFLFNSPGVFIYYHENICNTDQHMLVGSIHYLINYTINFIIMIYLSILYIKNYFSKKESWKGRNILYLEMGLCSMLSILFPITFDFFH